MELKIDVEIGKYLSKEDLEEEIKYAIEEYATREVNEYFKIHSYRDFIKQVASDIFWRSIEEMGEDTRGAIRNAVRKKIVELQPYQLVGYVYDIETGKREVAPVQQIINEEAEKLRPKISNMLRSTIRKAVEDDFPTVCADALYDILSRAQEVSE